MYIVLCKDKEAFNSLPEIEANLVAYAVEIGHDFKDHRWRVVDYYGDDSSNNETNEVDYDGLLSYLGGAL